jgi:uncharacterized membrane protein
MNQYPQFPGRGFGYGPGAFQIHQHVADPALAWATFALVLLLVLAVGAMIVARLAGGGGRRHRRQFRFRGAPDPLDVLRMRFASGQITREEFLQGMSDLTPPGPPQPAA